MNRRAINGRNAHRSVRPIKNQRLNRHGRRIITTHTRGHGGQRPLPSTLPRLPRRQLPQHPHQTPLPAVLHSHPPKFAILIHHPRYTAMFALLAYPRPPAVGTLHNRPAALHARPRTHHATLLRFHTNKLSVSHFCVNQRVSTARKLGSLAGGQINDSGARGCNGGLILAESSDPAGGGLPGRRRAVRAASRTTQHTAGVRHAPAIRHRAHVGNVA